MNHFPTTRSLIGEMLAINNQAQAAEIHRLRVENALLRDNLAAVQELLAITEQRHESLTALVIAGEA